MKRNKEVAERKLGFTLINWYVIILFCVTVLALTVIIILNLFDVLKSWSSDLVEFTLVSVIFLISSIIYAFVVGKILRPLKELSRGTQEIERGNYDIQIKNTSPSSEVGRLIANFNHMAHELNHVELFRKDFISNFSHEFKTPIISISGFANRLMDDGLSREKQKEYAAIIVKESERLTTLASNILLLSKYENQQALSDITAFSLDEQLRLTLLEQEKKWDAKGLEPALDLEEITLHSNEKMLQQVWINLLDNAIKFSPEGGVLSVTCHKSKDAQSVTVMIADNGIGMDEKTIAHIFEQFYQGDPAHQATGNGLGLSIVKRIVALCQGSVSVESRLGSGTTFRVTLPLIPQLESHESKEKRSPSQ